jgi:hypothetical protein
MRQGCCPAAPVSEKAAIAADIYIARALEAIGIYCLLISAGGIALKGYIYGFIGGACDKLGPRFAGFERYRLCPVLAV